MSLSAKNKYVMSLVLLLYRLSLEGRNSAKNV